MKNNTLFFHGISAEGMRFTIAGKFEKDNLILGLSLCSDKDNFCKKTGRIKAEGRMNQKQKNASGTCIIKCVSQQNEEIKTFIKVVSEKFNCLTKKELKQQFNIENIKPQSFIQKVIQKVIL